MANTTPIFPGVPKISWATLTAANTAMDGTGTTALLFTAGSSGSRIDTIKIKHLGVNVATVLRLFINNGSATTTAANNTMHEEYAVPANASLNQAGTNGGITLKFDGSERETLNLPPGYKLYVTIGTAVAAGLQITAEGGDY